MDLAKRAREVENIRWWRPQVDELLEGILIGEVEQCRSERGYDYKRLKLKDRANIIWFVWVSTDMYKKLSPVKPQKNDHVVLRRLSNVGRTQKYVVGLERDGKVLVDPITV